MLVVWMACSLCLGVGTYYAFVFQLGRFHVLLQGQRINIADVRDLWAGLVHRCSACAVVVSGCTCVLLSSHVHGCIVGFHLCAFQWIRAVPVGLLLLW
jgi:hypothetical protein